MKKRFLYVVFLMTLLSPVMVAANDANEDEDRIEEEMQEEEMHTEMVNRLSLDEINSFWNDIHNEYGEYLHDIPSKNLSELIKDEDKLSFTSVFRGLLTFLFFEIIVNGKLLGTLIVLTLFSVILHAINAAFEKSTVSKVAHFIVFIVLIYITLSSFYSVVNYAQASIEQMSSFMIALLPLMLGLLATFGQVMSVTFFHPIVIFLIHASGLLMTNFVFPLLSLSALLMMVSYLNDKYQATYLAQLFKQISLGALGIFITIFLGVMSVQGTASAIQDGIALKTTKFITGNFIPVIGRSFTEAADTVLTAALLLKNAIGIIGLVIIAFIAVFPALKILVIAFIYKLAAAILQPLGNSPIILCLHMISKYILYILACVITVTFMFFLAIVLMIVASNIPFLLR